MNSAPEEEIHVCIQENIHITTYTVHETYIDMKIPHVGPITMKPGRLKF